MTFQKQSDSHMAAHVLPVHLYRYVILGNHDYGDKCYDEPPGCYVYGGDAFYSPLHQVPVHYSLCLMSCSHVCGLYKSRAAHLANV